jgi:hypothetical protein
MSANILIDLTKIPVYYINLDKDVEKRQAIESLLSELGFMYVNRFPGILDETKKVGVAQSHNQLLTYLKTKNTPFLVFEDDIDVFSFKKEIEIPADADAYYLGNSVFGLYNGIGRKKISVSKYDRNSHRIYNMLAAHAILYLNPEYVSFLAQATKFNISIKTNQDKARAETMKYWNVYASTTPAFYQKGLHEQFTKITLPGPRSSGPEGAFTYEQK